MSKKIVVFNEIDQIFYCGYTTNNFIALCEPEYLSEREKGDALKKSFHPQKDKIHFFEKDEISISEKSEKYLNIFFANSISGEVSHLRSKIIYSLSIGGNRFQIFSIDARTNGSDISKQILLFSDELNSFYDISSLRYGSLIQQRGEWTQDHDFIKFDNFIFFCTQKTVGACSCHSRLEIMEFSFLPKTSGEMVYPIKIEGEEQFFESIMKLMRELNKSISLDEVLTLLRKKEFFLFEREEIYNRHFFAIGSKIFGCYFDGFNYFSEDFHLSVCVYDLIDGSVSSVRRLGSRKIKEGPEYIYLDRKTLYLWDYEDAELWDLTKIVNDELLLSEMRNSSLLERSPLGKFILKIISKQKKKNH